ncbi:MAG: TIGR03936 family radical SAM-associated protein [Phascolarctobacterium sp.]|nr:TIGR03936 family radical SAM-associated protein [Phascolarctobacterium sp.]
MKLRMQITKDRDIRFISHLEYVRTIERAIRRAKLPAAYSEGFNPHLKFSLASALGVGVVSYTEFVEIELAEPMEVELAAKALDNALPRGIRVLAADAVANNTAALMAEAAGASYVVTLPSAEDISEAVANYNEAEELLFKKAAPKRKEKFKEIDVKFYIPKIAVEQKDGKTSFAFECKITPTGSMKAVDLLNALNEAYALNLPVEMADIERHTLYKVNKYGKKLPMLSRDAFKM